MTEDEVRQFELVRAIEIEDRDATLLTREDRAQAEAHARSIATSRKGSTAGDRFLAERAAFACARLTTRHPGIAGLLRRARWPRWLGLAVPAIALVAGFLANELGTGKQLDLLAVPLLGTIAWNLLVYLSIFATMFVGSANDKASPIYRAIARLGGIGPRDFDRGTALRRAANAFESRWASLSGPVVSARIARTLHLGAALFAAGLVGGIYLRALVIEYRAGWESTLLGPEAVHVLLSLLLGPASWASGIALPNVDGIAAMRWTGPNSGGVNAETWIHLYTLTVGGLVILPRLLLAFWQGGRATWMAQRLPIPGREDFYVRRLLRGASGAPPVALVTPYAYTTSEETRRQLTRALQAALGDSAQVNFDEAIEYGAEERWLDLHPGDPEDDYHIVLFTLSATPEDENHGALARELAAHIAAERPGTVLAVIIDETPYRQHFAGQAGLEERIEGRIDAWRKVLAKAGVTPLCLDLSQSSDDALPERLESGLLRDGALSG